jgi:hypothetical protein
MLQVRALPGAPVILPPFDPKTDKPLLLKDNPRASSQRNTWGMKMVTR